VKWHYWALTVIFIALGISTLVPAPASKPCLLGYYAHCSATPISTAICWIIAGVIGVIGRKRAKKVAPKQQPEGSK